MKCRVWLVLGPVGTDDLSYIACVYSDGNHRVPNVNRNSDGDWKFNLGNFENDWNDDNCLLCFCYSFFFSHQFIFWWEFFLADFSSIRLACVRPRRDSG